MSAFGLQLHDRGLRQVDHLRTGFQDQPGQHSENLISTKNAKISWVWWYAPLVPANQEAEQENHLNARGGGCSELRLWHCTPAWQQNETPSEKTKINQRWWQTSVVPATQEAEARELLEPGRQRLQ